MPVSILISQSAHRDPRQREFEEQLVTELLMEDGLEVHVIPHFNQLQEDDTGRLCLESLTAHIIALSWLTPLEAFQQMQNLGAPGRFGRTNHAKETPEVVAGLNHPRTIYNLDLSRFASVRECREEIKRIIDEQSVSVVSIGGGQVIAPRKAPSQQPDSQQPDSQQPDSQQPDQQQPDQQRPQRQRPEPEPQGGQPSKEPDPTPPAAPAKPVDWDDEDELDRLVDELDDLDI